MAQFPPLFRLVLPLICAFAALAPMYSSASRRSLLLKTVKGPGPCDFWWYKPPEGSVLNLTAVITPGTNCTWTWDDDNEHSVTPRTNTVGWKWKGDAVTGKGHVYWFKFDKEGTYKFVCSQHLTAQKGVIVVKAGTTGTPSPPPPSPPPRPPPRRSPPKSKKSPPPPLPPGPPPPRPPPKSKKSPPKKRKPPPPKKVKRRRRTMGS